MIAVTTQPVNSNELFLDNGKHSFELVDHKDAIKGDPELQDALQRSWSEQSLMPLVKQELRCKIQNRRMSTGAPELRVTFDPPKSYPLTPEELIKNEVRRQRNRRSALKSRMKRKTKEETLEEEFKQLQKENDQLLSEVNALRKVKATLAKTYQTHASTCPNVRTNAIVLQHKDTMLSSANSVSRVENHRPHAMLSNTNHTISSVVNHRPHAMLSNTNHTISSVENHRLHTLFSNQQNGNTIAEGTTSHTNMTELINKLSADQKIALLKDFLTKDINSQSRSVCPSDC